MSADNPTLLQALTTSIRDLQQGIDRHSCLVASILENQVDPEALKPLLNGCPAKTRELAMKQAIIDAIDTLEASRKSFKSKQLEALRKRLTEVLIDMK